MGERHVPPASVSEYVFQHDRFSLFLFHVNLRREREREIFLASRYRMREIRSFFLLLLLLLLLLSKIVERGCS